MKPVPGKGLQFRVNGAVFHHNGVKPGRKGAEPPSHLFHASGTGPEYEAFLFTVQFSWKNARYPPHDGKSRTGKCS